MTKTDFVDILFSKLVGSLRIDTLIFDCFPYGSARNSLPISYGKAYCITTRIQDNSLKCF